MNATRQLRRLGIVAAVVLLSQLTTSSYLAADEPTAATPQPTMDFNRQIRPILSNKCFACHGPDEAKRSADLRLDQRAAALADRGGYAAIRLEQPEQSELLVRVSATDPDLVMPPPETGKTISAAERRLLADWIAQGAPYAEHWSYTPPTRPLVPSLPATAPLADWPRQPLDGFVLARLQEFGWTPAPPAERHALARRLALALTGLPPTLTMVQDFVADESPDAYERYVDRLLASPAFGEHWAKMWLDLARYADSAGYADDPLRTIWAYRDYVIRSFNANKPFDQFTIEQIAGDLLPNPTEDQLIATAFHRNTLTNNEGGTDDEEFRNVAVVDRVNTTFAVWMGTTMACAQCHTHKYDPITQEDYFRVFALFNNTADTDRRDESPLHEIYTDEQRQQQEQWRTEIQQLQNLIANPTADIRAGQNQWEEKLRQPGQWQQLALAVPKPNESSADTTSGIATSAPEAASHEGWQVEALLPAGNWSAVQMTLAPTTVAGTLTQWQLEVLPATGNTSESAAVPGRFVRIELPGKQKLLSLAEVQVWQGEQNLARKGKARQSSTAYGGNANRAIDGNTDGDYYRAQSTTHTQTQDEPWWEVDLQSVQPIDRIVVWNRTDGNLGDRLQQFRVQVLNDRREVVQSDEIAEAPAPQTTLAFSSDKPLARGWLGDPLPADEASVLLPDQSLIVVPSAVPLSLTLLPEQPILLSQPARLRLRGRWQTESNEKMAPTVTVLAVTSVEMASTWRELPIALLLALTKPSAARLPHLQEQLAQLYLERYAPELIAARQRLVDLEKQLREQKPYTTVPIFQELPPDRRRQTYLQYRGNFLDKGPEVQPGIPAAFVTVQTQAKVPDRLALAHWLVSPQNPLTARVLANRLWERLFGVGLVHTSEDFGSQGELPTHPQLLDWLACELVETGWDMKRLIRLIVTSATYRQSAQVQPDEWERDPENHYFARGPRFRLSAETIRDQALFVSGLLSPKRFGPPVRPPQPSTGLSAAFGSGVDWETSTGEDRYRRGLYTQWRRSSPYPSLATFDAPNREVCTIRRPRTNTPLQALVTLNDPVYVEAAQALALRLVHEGGATPADKIRHGFLLTLSRPATATEVDRLVALVEATKRYYQEHPELTRQLLDQLPPPMAPVVAELRQRGLLVPAEIAAWAVVGNVLLNLDEIFMCR